MTISKQGKFSRVMKSNQRGASAVEYGLMLALVAVAVVVIASTMGADLAAIFTHVSDNIPSVPSS